MRFLPLLYTLVCTFLFVSSLPAQIVNINKVKFGKISEEELTMSSYPLDEQAEAVVLYDKATLRMNLDKISGGFQYIMDRHLRIKILRTSGTHYGDFVIPLESSGGGSSAREEIVTMRAATFNWVNGEEEETKLNKDGVFIEKVTDNYKLYKLAFSQVKEGSVLELKYTMQSDFLYNLPVWNFQKEIPVDYSYFEVEIPEYFTYNIDMKGFATSSLTENVVNESGYGSAGQTPSKINFITKKSHWAAVEVPKLSDENYSPSVKNYFFRVSFELANVKFPGQFSNNYSTSWESISENYREVSNIINYLKPRNVVSELAATWVAGVDSSTEKVHIIYEKLKNTIIWDEWFSRYPRETPANVLKVKTGNSADLNFMLLSMLTSQGIAAEPVLVSTRNNGLLSYATPSLTQFNHMIVLVTLSPDNKLLLDATEKAIPSFLLAKHNINDRGRLMRENSSEWIDLSPPANNKMAAQFQLTLDNDGQLKGTAKIKQKDYAALDFRYEAETQNGIKNYIEKKSSVILTDVETTGFSDIYQDVIINAQADFSEQVMDGGELFYIPSILMKSFNENPFKAEIRELPIDFVVPQNQVYSSLINFPEGMVLEEIPESVSFSLPNKNGSYSIRYINMNGNIQIVEKLSIKETFYTQGDYAILRKFFDLILENQAVPLVIRKKP